MTLKKLSCLSFASAHHEPFDQAQDRLSPIRAKEKQCPYAF